MLLSALLKRQHGVVAKQQLRDLGLSDDSVDRRVRQGRLLRVQRGYAVGHDDLRDKGRWLAAVLASGDGAVLSHRSAAALWGLMRPAPMSEVTVPRKGNRRGSRGALKVHRSTRLSHPEVTKRHGIPVTKPAPSETLSSTTPAGRSAASRGGS